MTYKDDIGDELASFQKESTSGEYPLIQQLKDRAEAGVSTFIVFEGTDGSGKTTQIKSLYETLQRAGLEVYLTREPGGSALAEVLRKLIFDNYTNVVTEILLFLAARIDHVETFIKPRLESSGAIVLCDRYIGSTFAYQGSRDDTDKLYNLIWDLHEQVNEHSTLPIPDLTFYLKTSPETAAERLGNRSDINRFDDTIAAKTAVAFAHARRLECIEKAFDSIEFTGAEIEEIDAEGSLLEVQEAILNTTFGFSATLDDTTTWQDRLYLHWLNFKDKCTTKMLNITKRWIEEDWLLDKLYKTFSQKR